jgi:hypothetical protein
MSIPLQNAISDAALNRECGTLRRPPQHGMRLASYVGARLQRANHGMVMLAKRA